LVSSQPEHTGGFHPSGPGTDDHDATWARRRAKLVDRLPSCHGVHEAANLRPFSHPIDARVAGDARADLFRPLFLHLTGPLGVGNQLPAEGYHICVTFFDSARREGRIVEATDRDDRNLDDLLDGCGQREENSLGIVHGRRYDRGRRHGAIAPSRHVEDVGPCLDEPAANLFGLLQANAPGSELIGAQAKA